MDSCFSSKKVSFDIRFTKGLSLGFHLKNPTTIGIQVIEVENAGSRKKQCRNNQAASFDEFEPLWPNSRERSVAAANKRDLHSSIFSGSIRFLGKETLMAATIFPL